MSEKQKESPLTVILGLIIVALMLYMIYGADVRAYLQAPQATEPVSLRVPTKTISPLADGATITVIRVPDTGEFNDSTLFDRVCLVYEDTAHGTSTMDCRDQFSPDPG